MAVYVDDSVKAKKILGFVYRVFGSSGQHCLARLYKSIVLPHLDYCSSLWDPQYQVHIKRLESVQTFAARIATKCWSDDGKGIKARLGWPELAVCHVIFGPVIFCPGGRNMIAISKYDNKFTCHISSSFAVFRPPYKFYSKTTISCLGS